MKNGLEFKDWLGRDIRVGDAIVYPGRQGSSLWMRVARVLELKTILKGFPEAAYPILKVKTISSNWDDTKISSVETIIRELSRVTVVPINSIPTKYAEHL